LIERLASEDLVDTVGELFHWRAVENFLRRRFQQELRFGMSERVVRDERRDVAQLGGLRFQEFSSRWNAVENIRDTDRSARRQACGFHAEQFGTGELDASSLTIFWSVFRSAFGSSRFK